MPDINIDLEDYLRSRNVLITSLVTVLSNDERILAAWLTGSYGRKEADAVSDLDLTVVVAQPHHEILCARQEQMSHTTSSERLELFSRFGNPALIHENNHNAPENGTFTFVLYEGSALMVDWTLIPAMNVERPFYSLLFFDKGNIPVSAPPAPEELEESKKAVAEIWSFFWMMTAITIRHITRGDLVFVQTWLEQLQRMIREIERRMERIPGQQAYRRGSLSQFQATREKQIEALQQLCNQMQRLTPRVTEFIGVSLADPSAEIDTLFALTNR
jgi:predicted nucleotidyltransferase